MSVDEGDRSGSLSTREGFLSGSDLETARSEIVSFVRETVDRADADGVVVGLSGGVDSTLAAFLAVEALGPERVLGVNLRSDKRDRLIANEARTIAEALGIEFEAVMLRPVVERFEETVGEALGDRDGDGGGERSADHVRGNAIARLRMAALYYAANDRSLLVLGTANRTELLTGYFTKHGDGGADLFPLGDLYKTDVRALARRVGVPRRIVAKPSTADFWAGQTDEDELGADYEVVDALLHRVVDRGATVGAAAEDLPIDDARAVELLAEWGETGHKRRRPPIPRVREGPGPADHRRTPDADHSGPTAAAEAPAPGGVGTTDEDPAPSERANARSWSDGRDLDGRRDALFAALADERRRAILAVLYGRDEPIGHRELLRAVVDRTVDGPPTAASPGDFETASIALWHVHLPALAEAGLVETDRDRRTVRLTPAGQRLRPALAPLLG